MGSATEFGAHEPGDAGSLDPQKTVKRVQQNDQVLARYLTSIASGKLSLDQKLRKFEAAVAECPDASVLCLRMSTAALEQIRYTRSMFQSVHILIGLMFMAILPFLFWKTSLNGTNSSQHFEFRVLAVRGGAAPQFKPNIKGVGLLRDGLPVTNEELKFLQPSMQRWEDGLVRFSYSQPVSFNGFFFITGKGAPEKDPVKFGLWSSEDKIVWTKVGSSSPLFDHYNLAWDLGDTFDHFHNTTMQRSAYERLDRRLDLLTAYRVLQALALVVPEMFVPLLLVRFGYVSWAHKSRMLFGFCSILSHMSFIQGPAPEAISQALGVVLRIVSVFQPHLFRKVVTGMLTEGICWLCYGLALIALKGTDPVGTSAIGVSVIFHAGYIWLQMMLIRRETNKTVDKDRAEYDALWTRMKECVATCSGLEELERVCASIQASCPWQGARHLQPARNFDSFEARLRKLNQKYNRSQSNLKGFMGRMKPYLLEETSVSSPNSWSNASVHDPVHSLDQLYAQAHLLEPQLVHRVKEWASISGGWFNAQKDVDKDDPFVEWNRCKKMGTENAVKFCSIKLEDRAIEKVVRCYAGDCSFVCDIARQAIVFKEPEQIVTCLRAMRADDCIEIVRVKNRLHHLYDSSETAGYRDVTCNFRFSTTQAIDQGLERHICEVQLLLFPFAKLKHSNQGGHSRYVVWRNLKAQ